jgi:hypothetical protein
MSYDDPANSRRDNERRSRVRELTCKKGTGEGRIFRVHQEKGAL